MGGLMLGHNLPQVDFKEKPPEGILLTKKCPGTIRKKKSTAVQTTVP
jgi:hypothetical protein